VSGLTIALATYNGDRFLADQLQSFVDQTHVDWTLWVSDDGSTDGTLRILQDFQTTRPQGQVHVVQGPQQGAAMNFLSLLHHPDLPDQAVAVADQDDVWFPHKLKYMQAILSDPEPVLYAGRTIVADEHLEQQRPSKPLTPAPSFQNALIQNRAAGNTIVLNQAAVRQLRKIGAPTHIAHHDWWLYQIMTGIGAKVIFDETPLIIYRQHGTNVFGANEGMLQSVRRMAQLMGPKWRGWAKVQHAALAKVSDHLTPSNQATFETWMTAPSAGPKRARVFTQLGLHRHKPLQTKLLKLLAVLGRI